MAPPEVASLDNRRASSGWAPCDGWFPALFIRLSIPSSGRPSSRVSLIPPRDELYGNSGGVTAGGARSGALHFRLPALYGGAGGALEVSGLSRWAGGGPAMEAETLEARISECWRG